MPRFIFRVNKKVFFQCFLKCSQCKAKTHAGHRCSRNVCIGLPYCSQHLKSHMDLNIGKSHIPNANKGIFAYNPNKTIVFKKGDIVCEYSGEVLSTSALLQRYGPRTAPYTFELEKNAYIDSACERCVASIINHSKKSNVDWDIKQGKVYLRAKKNIKHGTELYVDYGPDYILHENMVSHTTV